MCVYCEFFDDLCADCAGGGLELEDVVKSVLSSNEFPAIESLISSSFANNAGESVWEIIGLDAFTSPFEEERPKRDDVFCFLLDTEDYLAGDLLKFVCECAEGTCETVKCDARWLLLSKFFPIACALREQVEHRGRAFVSAESFVGSMLSEFDRAVDGRTLWEQFVELEDELGVWCFKCGAKAVGANPLPFCADCVVKS